VAILAISRIRANLCALFHRKLDFSQIAEIGNSGFEEMKRTVSSLFHLSGKLRTHNGVSPGSEMQSLLRPLCGGARELPCLCGTKACFAFRIWSAGAAKPGRLEYHDYAATASLPQQRLLPSVHV